MGMDATSKRNLSLLQKCTTTIHMLAYGSSTDSVDEYVWIGESTVVKCFKKFAKRVNEVFGAKYWRRPKHNNIEHLLQIKDAHGFLSMLGSIDCMHWEWKICPTTWNGQFCQCDHGKSIIVLKVVTSQDLWIWHAFFGVASSNNDINVINQFDVFNDVLQKQAP